jgi:hypothetical protein
LSLSAFSPHFVQSALDASFQPNVMLFTRALATRGPGAESAGKASQWVLGKPFGYAHARALHNCSRGAGHALQAYLRAGAEQMSRAGQRDMMLVDGVNGPPFGPTAARVATHMQPPPRSILLKQPLDCAAEPCPKPATALPVVLGNGTVVLSDPVHAPADTATGDMDVGATVAAVVRSAKVRRFFWVFLDHKMTAAPLERVLDALPSNVVPVNLDQGLRLFAREPDAFLQPAAGRSQ